MLENGLRTFWRGNIESVSLVHMCWPLIQNWWNARSIYNTTHCSCLWTCLQHRVYHLVSRTDCSWILASQTRYYYFLSVRRKMFVMDSRKTQTVFVCSVVFGWRAHKDAIKFHSIDYVRFFAVAAVHYLQAITAV